MRKRFWLMALAAVPAAAPAAHAEDKLPDSVECVYDGMTAEGRENAQMLLVSQGTRPDEATTKELNELVNRGINACIDLYPWSAGETNSAGFYAVDRLSIDFIAGVLRDSGRDPIAVRDYYVANRARLDKLKSIDGEQEALGAALAAKGWDVTDKLLIEQGFHLLILLRELNRFAAGFRNNVSPREVTLRLAPR